MRDRDKYSEGSSEPSNQEPLFKMPNFTSFEGEGIGLKKGALIFGGVACVGLAIGSVIATQVFIGTASLLGLAVMADSYKPVKYIIQRSNMIIDLIIFAGSIYAVSALGVTVAGALVFTGLGYTLVLAPYIRNDFQRNRDKYKS